MQRTTRLRILVSLALCAVTTSLGAAPFAYFTSGTELKVVDVATNTLVASVPGGNNAYAVTVSPNGARAYMSNFDTNSVAVIDTVANAVIASVTVPAGPQELIVDPSGTRTYVASFTAGQVVAIDNASNAVVGTVPVPGATALTVSNDGGTLYVAAGNTVVLVDTVALSVTGTIPAPSLSAFGSIVISPDGGRLYAWADQSAKVGVFDAVAKTFLTSVSIPNAFANDGLAVHPSGSPVYHSNGSMVTLIDAATNAVSGSVPLGATPNGINGVAVTDDGTRVYAATASGVKTFDTATATVSTVATGSVRAMGRFVGPTLPAQPSVAGGARYFCALSVIGRVSCWGENGRGQLGNGTRISTSTAVAVAGLPAVARLSVGTAHACAVTRSGGAKCWGQGGAGRLGNGGNVDQSAPVDVSGLGSGIGGIAAGGNFSCALSVTGGVKCWGGNSTGALGNGTTTNSSIPVNVTGLAAGVKAISAGADHACAVTVAGALLCWGSNALGQLGTGVAGGMQTAPVPVPSLASGVVDVQASTQHTCALMATGGMKCWGLNYFGNLGDGTTIDRPAPVDVSGLATGVRALGKGFSTSCALLASGGVKCWDSNGFGQVGNGTLEGTKVPVDVIGLPSPATALGLGNASACAMLADGSTRCWGGNDTGQLGNAMSSTRRSPVRMDAFAGNVASVSRGLTVRCFLTNVGGVKCIGNSEDGELGNGTVDTTSIVPVDVTGLTSGVVAVAVGNEHGCALLADATVKCWGWNGFGTLGNGTTTNSSVPVVVTGLTGVSMIAAGAYHSCAIVAGGAIRCWGSNSSGQLGDGSTSDRATPVPVPAITSGATLISGGDSHTCAIVAGSARCWGSGLAGELGNGGNAGSSIPVQVAGLASGVTDISTGSNFSCALVSGAANCWGLGTSGQLGNGGVTSSNVPVTVSGLPPGMTQVTVGSDFACANTANNVHCWGSNRFGSLGIAATTASVSLPQRVQDLSFEVQSVVTGSRTSCVTTISGELRCWGAGTYGLLGGPPGSSTPVSKVNSIIYWRHASGANASWRYVTGAATGLDTSVLPGVNAAWNAVASCPISEPGARDLVWLSAAGDGQPAIWLTAGGASVSSAVFPIATGSSDWIVAGCGDLDADGIGDLLWRNAVTGEIRVWYMRTNGQLRSSASIATPPLSFSIRGLADVNGDGIRDIVFFEASTGQVAIYQMASDGTYTAFFPGSVGAGSGWNIYGTGDLDGDGREDLVWRHDSGPTAVWYLNGGAVETSQFLYSAQLAEWTLAAVGDFADRPANAMLWYSPTLGQVARWTMQGRTVLPLIDPVLGVGSGWQSVR